jgi:hypothetical protein
MLITTNTKFKIDNISREELLWTAVIEQLILDYFGISEARYRGHHKKQAESWLDSKNKDFLLICKYANIESKWVLDLLKSGKYSKFIMKKMKAKKKYIHRS